MINGVPYPIRVKDQDTLAQWIASIDREVGESNGPSALFSYVPGTAYPSGIGHREICRSVYFKKDDAESEAFAKAMVCQQMAMALFSHLIKVPKGKIVWRIHPEFDVSHDTIPSDLSQVMNRKQMDAALGPTTGNKPITLEEVRDALGKSDWGVDFTTDSIFPVAAPLGEWRMFKSYARYSVVLDGEVIHAYGAAA